MKSLLPFLLIVPAVVSAVADDEHVCWIPNPCDRFYGLPTELQDGFKSKNPQVTDLNLIYSYTTYKLVSTPAPYTATWSWVTTGRSTLLTSHYDLATVTCLQVNKGGSTVASVTENHITQNESTGTELRPTSTTQRNQPIDNLHKGPATVTSSQSTTAAQSSVAGTTTRRADSAATTAFPTTSAAATESSSWQYCFHELDFLVDTKVTTEVVGDFCKQLADPYSGGIVKEQVDGNQGWWKTSTKSGSKYGYYICVKELKSNSKSLSAAFNVPNIADLTTTCIDTLNKVAGSCINGGKGGIVESMGHLWTLQPFLHLCR